MVRGLMGERDGSERGPRWVPRRIGAIGSAIGWERAALGAVLAFALAIRLLWLHRVPANLTADEADNLRVVLRIWEQGQPGFFGLDWKPAPAFSTHLMSWFMRVFGDGQFGVRSASAILSAVALVPFYALARRVVGIPAALAGAVLLASGRWYLHFSRSGWENVQVGLFALVSGWALTVAWERGQRRWYVLAGGAAALGLYGYFAGRLILPALLATAPLAWWTTRRRGTVRPLTGRSGPLRVRTLPLGERRRDRDVLVGYALVAATAILLFLPQARTIRRNWDYFNQRTAVVNIMNTPLPYLGEETRGGLLLLQLERTVSGYVLLDGSLFNHGRYSPPGRAIYDRVTGVLFVAGLALGVVRWRKTALWWTLLWIPLLGTQVLTSGTPDAARAVGAAPFVYLFVALALDAVVGLPRRLIRTPRWRPFARRATLVAVGVMVAAVAAWNVRDYADWIATPDALRVREPAVTYADYPVWRDTVRCELSGGVLRVAGDGHRSCADPVEVAVGDPVADR